LREAKMVRGYSRDYIKKVSNEMVQLQLILGLVEQIEFANKSDVLPDYFIDITVRRKSQMTRIDVDKVEAFAVIKDSIPP